MFRSGVLCAVLSTVLIPALALAQALPKPAPKQPVMAGSSTTAPTAPKQGRFDEIDTNHDGFLSRDEFLAAEKKRFDEFDTNHDGKTDAKEAIKASLVLTDHAKKFVQTTMTDEQTDSHLKSGKRTDAAGHLMYAERELPDQPVYKHWSNVTTTRGGAEIRSTDPESAGGRYMTEEQINGAAGERRGPE